MNEKTARREICRIGKSLFERGYVHSTSGNISVRLEDGVLVTPTDACLGFLEAADLALLDLQGRQMDGPPPTKSLALHMRIYDADHRAGGSARCVIHTHSTHCVALTLNGARAELLPAITPYFVMKVGHVPVIPYSRPGSPTVGERVASAIDSYARAGTPLRAVMLARLGPNVWHESAGQAMAVLEELEESARLALLTSERVEPLDAAALAELRSVFGARW